MASLNKVLLMGNACKDIELRYTGNGTAVAEFSIAVNEKYGDKETTVFINVTVWKKQAENCQKYLQKGSSVLIEGKWCVDEWDDRETGKKRQKAFVTAHNVQFLSKSNNQQQGSYNQDQQYQGEHNQSQVGDLPSMPNDNIDTDQDVPF